MVVDGKYVAVKLHRYIMDAPPGVPVDHRDGNGLNCTRANMRLATSQQNLWNQSVRRDSASGLKGVARSRKGPTWTATIRCDGQRFRLGVFPTAEMAALAYDAKARELFGEFARLNFPKSNAPAPTAILTQSSTGFRGVVFSKQSGKYRAEITVNYKCRHLGVFDNPIDASRAYDAAARAVRGDKAKLNFP